jgi:hypothetical protein
MGREAAMAAIYTFGPFRLDVAAGILFRGPEPVALGQRAVALLHLLVEGAGTPISKDMLIESAWPGLAIEDSNLTVQIAALRCVNGGAKAGQRGGVKAGQWRRMHRHAKGPARAPLHVGGENCSAANGL